MNVEQVGDSEWFVSDCCGKPFKIRGEVENVPAVPEALSRDVYGRTQPRREAFPRNGKRFDF